MFHIEIQKNFWREPRLRICRRRMDVTIQIPESN